MFRLLSRRIAPAISAIAKQPVTKVQRIAPVCTSLIRKSSTAVTLTDEELDAQWVEFFDDPELDYFDFCRGFNEVWLEDAVPEPVIIQSALYACRRLDNLPVALRCLEMVRVKCTNKEEIYKYIIQELGPTLDDLGLKTPEQLGIDKVTEE